MALRLTIESTPPARRTRSHVESLDDEAPEEELVVVLQKARKQAAAAKNAAEAANRAVREKRRGDQERFAEQQREKREKVVVAAEEIPEMLPVELLEAAAEAPRGKRVTVEEFEQQEQDEAKARKERKMQQLKQLHKRIKKGGVTVKVAGAGTSRLAASNKVVGTRDKWLRRKGVARS